MPKHCPLMDLSDKMLDLYEHSNSEEDLRREGGLALMVATIALQVARAQLITLGGDGSGGDRIQKAVLDQIDVALERK